VRAVSDKPSPFVPLLDGKETADQIDLRYKTYQAIWSEQEVQIQVRLMQEKSEGLADYDQNLLQESDAAVLSEVVEFVRDPSSEAYV
jgi:origin recognition complex subunit 3